MKKLVILFLLLPLYASSQKPTSANYAHGVWRGGRNLPILVNDPRMMVFSLTTSWIPGAEHKGQFRYQLSLVPSVESETQKLVDKTPPYGWDVPDVITKLHACSYSLEVLDEGGFILQRVPIVFTTVVDDNGQAIRLTANDYFPMDLAQYRSFLEAKSSESWNMEWTCI